MSGLFTPGELVAALRAFSRRRNVRGDHRAVVYFKGKVVFSCKHKHRTYTSARNCADDALIKLQAKARKAPPHDHPIDTLDGTCLWCGLPAGIRRSA